ncbi:hypothetical protein MK079_01715 [Candidatus Gracilibacteria bacterium]|nr:hypothetical protein [Candidatus Gracilibacteria bacterium]
MRYISQLLFLILFSSIIIYTYYSVPAHQESFDGYSLYIVFVGIVYALYKGLQCISDSRQVSFSLANLIGYGLIHLGILCVVFFSLNNMPLGNSLSLFFGILGFLLLPGALIFIFYVFGKQLFEKKFILQQEAPALRSIMYIVSGGAIYITLLAIISFFGIYNLGIFILLSVGILALSYRHIYPTLKGISIPVFELKGHDFYSQKLREKIQPYLLSSEFFFIVITFLISINLISIYRPMPIGWDDLGIYMNYPNLIAQTGESLKFGGMYAWQVFTSIGFLFESNRAAFYLNNIGSILSVVFIALITHDIFKNKKKHTLINIPLFLSAIFIALPMIIFQQAKDMKIDPALFAFSIVTVYFLFQILKNIIKEKYSTRQALPGFLLVGGLLGFLFAFKLTSLLTIIAGIGIVFFVFLGGYGVLGYLVLVNGFFSYFGLWDMMNVVLPSSEYISWVSLISILLGLLCIGYSVIQKKINAFCDIGKVLGVISIGICITLLPWLGKNIYQSTQYDDQQISFSTLLNGKSQSLQIDFSQIYDKDKINDIKKAKQQDRINNTGTTQDEDLGRYFGYETGLNNYLKLPFNITMQVNQGGEFTDISYIFLAILPAILVFLPYKHPLFVLGPVIGCLGLLGFFYVPLVRDSISVWASGITLPVGYIYFFLLFLIPTLYFVLTLRNCNKGTFLKILFVFTSIYVYLWAVSAYGIVWYGIVMYFVFLLLIGFGMYYMSMYHIEKDDTLWYQGMGSIAIFLLIGFYFFSSAFPHGMDNLKNAGFKEFKTGQFSQNRAIFQYHSRYLSPLAELNIGDNIDDVIQQVIDDNFDEKMNNIVQQNPDTLSSITQFNSFLNEMARTDDNNIVKRAKQAQQQLYTTILYPGEKYGHTSAIYRIGTFLKFFIHQNSIRMYEDSLLTQFDTYFNDTDVDRVIDRIKGVGLDYILIDLNAATIDNDPRKDLTRRYESILNIFPSERLELVATDSTCLQIGYEEYDSSTPQVFMDLAGVNYDSKNASRGQKLLGCYQKIIDLYNTGNILGYNFLLPIANAFERSVRGELNLTPTQILQQSVGHGSFALFKIK